MSKPPLVSVIIPCFDDLAGLRNCLLCLSSQTVPPFEIIIIDNGSRPALPQLGGAKVLREHRPGSYRARNAGLDAAQGDVIAFTDADCMPRPDWIERGSAAVRSALLDTGRIGAIGGMINTVPLDPKRMTAAEIFERASGSAQRTYVLERGFAATGNMWTTRRTLEAVGHFNGDLLSGGDAEWGHRLKSAGGSVSYAEDVVIDHRSRRTLLSLYRQLRRVRSSPFRWHGSTAQRMRRGYRGRLQQFSSNTKGWPLHHRLIALAVAVAMELARPVADLELKIRRRSRL